MTARWAEKFTKKGAFPPEEQAGAATKGVAAPRQAQAAVGQQPQEQPKADSIADELPGENEDEQGEFYGQGDMAQNGQKQPVMDYTPCQWMAGRVQDGEVPGTPDSIVQTGSGAILVSCELCRQCEWEKGCYGLDDDEAEKVEDRTKRKMAAAAQGLGIDPAMPELLVAEKVARLLKTGALRDDDAATGFLRKKGYQLAGAEYIVRLSKSVEG